MSSLHILLVEDTLADIVLTEEAFFDATFPYTFEAVRDGEMALDYLEGQGEFAGRTLPDVMLVDINMPRMSGLELLDIVKSHDEWRDITVIILTTSKSENDIWESYNLSADAYIAKPVSLEDFAEVARNLGRDWASVVV